jgi:hypothetical protein
MIIVNLVVFNKEQINNVVSKALKNKWTLNVIVSNAVDSYYMDESTIKNHSGPMSFSLLQKACCSAK